MKNIQFFILLAALALAACKKDSPPPTPQEPEHLTALGTISFKKNGELLSVPGVDAAVFDSLTFCIQTKFRKIVQSPSIEEKLSICYIPFKIGWYPIQKFAINIPAGTGNTTAVLAWTIELDQPVGQLRSTDGFPTDFIEVIAIDTLAKTIEGRFQVHLSDVFNDDDLVTFGLPDSVHVTEGVFYLKTK